MPIYTFACDDGHKTEIFLEQYQTRILCEKCGKPADKVPSTTNFILKGKGWAKDGYNK